MVKDFIVMHGNGQYIAGKHKGVSARYDYIKFLTFRAVSRNEGDICIEFGYFYNYDIVTVVCPDLQILLDVANGFADWVKKVYGHECVRKMDESQKAISLYFDEHHAVEDNFINQSYNWK